MSETAWSVLVIALLLPFSIGVTRFMIFAGPKLGLVDVPCARRIHTVPIPRAGGIGVFVTMVLGLLLLKFVSGSVFDGPLGGRWLWHFLAASGILFLTGVIDDRKGMPAFVKLGAQIVAAVVMFSHNPGGAGIFMGLQIPWFVDLGIHVAWTVALINAFNLIDGMDGLCSGLGTIALIIMAALAASRDFSENSFVILVMVAALLGFLRYNFHPARIFLGDTGSMLVGFFIASVGTASVGRGAVVAGLLLPLLVGGVPLLDVALAIWRRGMRRVADYRKGGATVHIFGPDRDHLHHRLLSWGFTQRQALFLIYALAGITSLLALLPILGGASLVTASVVGVAIIGLVGLRYIAPVEFLESGRGIRALVRRPLNSRQMVLGYFLYDAVAIFACGLFSWYLLSKAMVGSFEWDQAAPAATIFTACSIAGLYFGRAHARRWTRAAAHDFAECVVWLTCGAGISFACFGMADSDFSFRDAIFHLCALMLSGAFVFGPRCVGFLLQESVIDTMHRKRRLSTKRARRTTLLYGAGDLGELFVCHLKLSQPDVWQDYHFVGFIDDSAGLRGRRLRGFPILGSLADLNRIVKSSGANSILITSSVLSEQSTASLVQFAEELGLEVERWQPEMKPESLYEPPSPPRDPKEKEGGKLQIDVPPPPATVKLSPA